MLIKVIVTQGSKLLTHKCTRTKEQNHLHNAILEEESENLESDCFSYSQYRVQWSTKFLIHSKSVVSKA